MNYFATNLRFIRENKGLSRSELARKMNVNQSTISRWENGEMGITVDKAYDLSETLNVPLPKLVGADLRNGDTEKKYTEDEKKEMLKQVLKEKGILNENEEMTKEDFDKLINIAKQMKDMMDNKKEH